MDLPQPKAGDQRRENIRKAAYRCFAESGYHDTTVDAICAAAGISKGSFYWAYPSKQEVFVDILDTWGREVMDELHDQFEAAVNSANYVEAITEALIRETRRGRHMLPLWFEFAAAAKHEPQLEGALARYYGRARTAIAEILRPVVAGPLDEEALQGVAAAVFGTYLGLMAQDLSDRETADAITAIRRVMGVLRPWLEQGYPR